VDLPLGYACKHICILLYNPFKHLVELLKIKIQYNSDKCDRLDTQVRKLIKKIFLKARIENHPFKLDCTQAGVTLQLLPGDPPGPPHLFFPHKHRHPGDDEVEDTIIFKGQDPHNLTSSTGS
jgi:hypothetical protein